MYESWCAAQANSGEVERISLNHGKFKSDEATYCEEAQERNYEDENGVNWDRVRADVDTQLNEGAPDGLLVINDARAVYDEDLLKWADAVVWVTAPEEICFLNCVAARVTQRYYENCVWPAHEKRSGAFLERLRKPGEEEEALLLPPADLRRRGLQDRGRAAGPICAMWA